jgi:hypothetical protein
VKDYQEVRANLITMLEELGENLDDVFKEEKLFENRVDKDSIEIEKSLLSDERFIIKKINRA